MTITTDAFTYNRDISIYFMRNIVQFSTIKVIFVVLFARWQLVPKVRNDDPESLILDFLNPKLIGFDIVSRSRPTTVASFKSFRPGVFVSSC